MPCRDQTGAASGNVLDARLAPAVAVNFERLTRHVFSASSCGVCGKATLDAALQNFPPVKSDARFATAMLAELPAKLRAQQPTFAATGGLHACALFDAAEKILCVREDVGRHNALDKLLGRALLDRQLPLAHAGVLLSGRVSFELVQKALAAGASLVAGIGAPSSLAIDCANRGGLTLVGFLRDDHFNVYAGGHEKKSFAGLLLAGGRSTRMGQDKAHLSWRGAALGEHQAATLAATGARPLFVSCRPEQAWTPRDFLRIEDLAPNGGALAAFVDALAAIPADVTLVLAIDLPLVRARWLASLATRATEEKISVVPRHADRFEPFAAAWHRSALSVLRETLARGDSLQAACATLRERKLLHTLALDADEAASLANLNTPAEVTALAGGHS